MSLVHRLFVAVALAAAATGPALAAYPDKPVRIVVPYAPGGSSDVMARAFSDQLAAELGQPVLIENRAGAGSMIATSYVVGEPADGYTLLLADVPFTIVPALYSNLRYDAKADFAPIALLGLSPMYLFVSPKSPAQSVADLVEHAGRTPLTIGSGGNGSLTHLMAELFMQDTGASLVHVPYKGASASVNDLAGAQIDVSFTTMPTAAALYGARRIRPVAVSSPERMAEAPEVPTFAELGYPGLTVQSWWGLMARKGTPSEAIGRLEAAMAKVMQSEALHSRLKLLGVAVPPDTSAQALSAYLDEDFKRWQDVVEQADIRLD